MPVDSLPAVVACNTCVVTGNMALQMALCGAVGGIVLIKLAAADLAEKFGRHIRHDEQDATIDWPEPKEEFDPSRE